MEENKHFQREICLNYFRKKYHKVLKPPNLASLREAVLPSTTLWLFVLSLLTSSDIAECNLGLHYRPDLH